LRLARLGCEPESVCVVLARLSPDHFRGQEVSLRFIGLDVHRDFCDVAIYENGKVRSAGRVASSPEQLQLFAQSLCRDDRVALETTGNALSIARILEPHVGGVLVADTRNVRAMTHAKVKNDRLDAQLLAKLLAAAMLPGTWVCDEQTRILRRQVTRRSQLVRGRTRARNQVHAVVIRNLGGRAPARDTFGNKGRAWLATLDLPADERAMVDSCLREADFLTHELAHIDREVARYAVGNAEIRRLMTIPGVDVTTAATLMATIGRIDRFPSPRHLVGYLGLDPRSRQSGVSPIYEGHISKQGSASARHVLCEAAHATMRAPGPLRAFGQRVRSRRGSKIATVAVARKLACLTWQLLTKQQDYIYERPALTFRKLRMLEIAAGAPKRSNPGGRNGPGTVDTPAQWRAERVQAIGVEKHYRAAVADWQPQRPSPPT
jgi:transposase